MADSSDATRPVAAAGTSAEPVVLKPILWASPGITTADQFFQRPKPRAPLWVGRFAACLLLSSVGGLEWMAGQKAMLRDPATTQFALVDITGVPAYDLARLRTFFNGENVYFVDGRWFTRHDGGWAYYRSEPSELLRYRQRHPELPQTTRRSAGARPTRAAIR